MPGPTFAPPTSVSSKTTYAALRLGQSLLGPGASPIQQDPRAGISSPDSGAVTNADVGLDADLELRVSRDDLITGTVRLVTTAIAGSGDVAQTGVTPFVEKLVEQLRALITEVTLQLQADVKIADLVRDPQPEGAAFLAVVYQATFRPPAQNGLRYAATVIERSNAGSTSRWQRDAANTSGEEAVAVRLLRPLDVGARERTTIAIDMSVTLPAVADIDGLKATITNLIGGSPQISTSDVVNKAFDIAKALIAAVDTTMSLRDQLVHYELVGEAEYERWMQIELQEIYREAYSHWNLIWVDSFRHGKPVPPPPPPPELPRTIPKTEPTSGSAEQPKKPGQ